MVQINGESGANKDKHAYFALFSGKMEDPQLEQGEPHGELFQATLILVSQTLQRDTNLESHLDEEDWPAHRREDLLRMPSNRRLRQNHEGVSRACTRPRVTQYEVFD